MAKAVKKAPKKAKKEEAPSEHPRNTAVHYHLDSRGGIIKNAYLKQ